MTISDHSALTIWQLNKHLSPDERLRMIDQCTACKGSGTLTVINDDGDEIGHVDCIKCSGLGTANDR